MVKAFVFDMDGVLCESEALMAEAACRMFRLRYGVIVSHADFVPFTGTGEDRYLSGVAARYGIQLTLPSDKEEAYRQYGELAREGVRAVPGAVDFLAAARSEGIRLAVATSADWIKMEINLAAIGVEQSLFDARVTGCQVLHKKPAPDIFLRAAALLECEPRECVVFEDAINGVQAAKAAGMRCLGITTGFPAETLTAHGADWTAPDFSTLPVGFFRESSVP